MQKKILILCLSLLTLSQLAIAADLRLTVQSDKSIYILGSNAVFTGVLKNLSQESYIENGDVEYIFSVYQDGIEIWRWSKLECG
ncbi:hypothetical protein FJZ33_04870 [Candidatus Poribacteria bacterium]|nr:hypothetical protein [Candidatus Poribacteria bacterium]